MGWLTPNSPQNTQVISRPLLLIFMDIIRTGNVPIFKKKEQRFISGNYRPVSLTSKVCKLWEGKRRDYNQDFADEFSIISSIHYGFMKGCSCQTELLNKVSND